MTNKKHSGFEKGSGCFTCKACGKLTRATGRGDNENCGLCVTCYDDAGWENEHSDTDGDHNGDTELAKVCCPICRQAA